VDKNEFLIAGTGVTVVLQWCHSGVTVVSLLSKSGVKVMLEHRQNTVGCLCIATVDKSDFLIAATCAPVVLPWCYSGVTAV
jgi:hypothetical protein